MSSNLGRDHLGKKILEHILAICYLREHINKYGFHFKIFHDF
jgi:hypothetical protein